MTAADDGGVELLAVLRRENPGRSELQVRLFWDALRIYLAASANVREHGAIVFHPKTGAPIQNPFLEVMARQGAVLAKFKGIRSDVVFR